MAKSPFISFEAETSRTIFKSKKNEKKSAKNAFPVYGWASKSLQKWYILHAKSWLCCYVKITIFHLSRYTDGAKRVTKNHSFLTSKLMFCYVKNRHFHRSTCVDAVKKCTTDMHFSLKNDHFSYKNHSFFNEKSMFSHIPVYRWSSKNLQQIIDFFIGSHIFSFKNTIFIVPRM